MSSQQIHHSGCGWDDLPLCKVWRQWLSAWFCYSCWPYCQSRLPNAQEIAWIQVEASVTNVSTFSRPRSFLTVELHPTDRESRKDVKRCSSSLPRDRLIFLMPNDKDKEGAVEDKEEERRIPEPRAAVAGGGTSCPTKVWNSFSPLTKKIAE